MRFLGRIVMAPYAASGSPLTACRFSPQLSLATQLNRLISPSFRTALRSYRKASLIGEATRASYQRYVANLFITFFT